MFLLKQQLVSLELHGNAALEFAEVHRDRCGLAGDNGGGRHRGDTVAAIVDRGVGERDERLEREHTVGDFELEADHAVDIDASVVLDADVGAGVLQVAEADGDGILEREAEGGQPCPGEQFEARPGTCHPAEVGSDRHGDVAVDGIEAADQSIVAIGHEGECLDGVAMLVFQLCLNRPAVVEAVLVVEMDCKEGTLHGVEAEFVAVVAHVGEVLVEGTHVVEQCRAHTEAELVFLEVEGRAVISVLGNRTCCYCQYGHEKHKTQIFSKHSCYF